MAQFLVLEEDGRQFEQLKQCLLAKGHKAWRVTKAAEACDFLSQYGIDLILSAVNLEKNDVFEFLRETKNNEKWKNIPFVFYCTDEERCERYATPTIMQAGKQLGARKYILQPKFDANRFWDELQECVPQSARKNDSLGGEVKTYSLTDLSWTKQQHAS